MSASLGTPPTAQNTAYVRSSTVLLQFKSSSTTPSSSTPPITDWLIDASNNIQETKESLPQASYPFQLVSPQVYDLNSQSHSCLFKSHTSRFTQNFNHIKYTVGTIRTRPIRNLNAQTWLLENGAPMFILANQNSAITYLSNHHLALIELIQHITHLLAVIQALLYSGTEP